MRKLFSLIAAVLFAGSMMADNFAVVSSVSDLADGDQIIITSIDTAYAISRTQNTNNRGVAAVSATDGVVVPGADVQIITLVDEGGNFMLLVGQDAYLYAASNSSNHLKTADAATVGDNGKFAITMDANGVASVVAQGSNARNDLRYNPSSSIFSCYASSSSIEAGLRILKKQGDVTPPAVATPVISGEAEFTDSVIVTITCSTLETDIYYTTDGTTDPKCDCSAAPEYKHEIVLKETTTIMAAAYTGNDWSAVATKTFTKKEPLPDTLSCAQAAEAALNGMTDNVKVRGYVTEIAYAWKDGSMSFWMADSLNGGKVFEAYKCAIEKQEDAVSVGDLVVATGKLTKYNTTPELAEGCTVEIIEKTQILPQNLGEKTIAEFLSLKNTLDTCILTGVVDSIMNTTYGNLYLSDATAQLYIYGVLNAAGEAKKFAELGVAAGDTLTVLAVYNEHQGAPQAKNAVFVEVKKAPAQDIEVKMTEGLTFMDNVASEGWWEMYGENDKFIIDLSNKETTQLEGTYTYEDLDPNYAFIVVINGTDSTEVNFVDGAVTLSKDAEQGTITIKGALIGEDGNVYNIELVFSEPKPTETVTVNIQNAQMETTYADYGLYGIYGYDENNVFVMLSVWAALDLEGQYTEQDLDFAYLGSGIIDGEDMVNIYKAAITITPGNGDDYLLTATLLCYNNKQYNVTMYIPAGQGIEDVEATVKAFKRIVNGQVIIEKNGVQYNVLGNTVK